LTVLQQTLQSGELLTLVDLQNATTTLDQKELDHAILCQYLDGIDPFELEEDELATPLLELLHAERKRFETTVTSLRNLALATRIYSNLGGATISSSIVETTLASADWAVTGRDVLVTRSLAFSCIVMMETGSMNIAADKLQEVLPCHREIPSSCRQHCWTTPVSLRSMVGR
jgi:hypothetical protein